MKDRNRRDSARRRDFMEWQHTREREYGHDQPWREERRHRYPDEPNNGERGRQFGERLGQRGRGSEGLRQWEGDTNRRGVDYRDDFGPDERDRGRGQGWGRGYGYAYGAGGEYRNDRRSGGGWDDYAREGDRARDWNTGGSFGFGPEETVEGRGSYGFGSAYGQGDLGSDRAGRGDWRDTDWVANRPARGRARWAGDWGEVGGNASTGSYAGRGPKDYRRSDDRIREEICDVLTDDPGLDAFDVSVKVESGEVTLMGLVSTREQKRRAEEDAERVSGVRDVINQLRVNRGETTGGAPSGKEKSGRGGAATG
jgi:hypothetical protein